MAGGPSPSSTSPPDTNSPFIPGSFSSSASSPPSHSSSGANLLSASALVGAPGSLSGAYNRASISPINERKPADKQMASLLGFGSKLEPSKSNPEMDANPTIFIRKLPRNTGIEALRSMLLFAKDLIDVDFVPADIPDDQNYASAIARFRTLTGAHEARDRLHGKINAAGDATMLVDVYQHGIMGAFGGRRNTMDLGVMRNAPTANHSMPTTNGNGNRQSSRFNGTFQSLERRSPPSANDPFPPDLTSHNIQGLFSPKSPLGSHYVPNKDSYTSSKAMINDDNEDDTGKILANPVEFAINGETNHNMTSARRPTQPNVSSMNSSLAGLSLNTKSPGAQASGSSAPMNNFSSTRAMSNLQSPASGISPHTTIPSGPHQFQGLSNAGTTNHSFGGGPYGGRHQLPPVNPADQNPPCNTLYVGNLPLDTSEDELKAMFSKQRGYKRLCFRTKQNGPMCFVEFEDVSFATKALNELYGHPLHNSVKGGIRLSFSKNPLGVRTGQSGPNGGLSGPGGLGMNNIPAPPGFSTANGPPPGLSAPPGLTSSMSAGSGMGGSSFGGWGTHMGGFGAPSMRTHSISSSMGASGSGGNFPGMNGDYAYMMGR
ncbi:hypothetical protein NA57DRAFT_63002 [Rhizodiscina lignyota]|uniref:RRM domain-containing protein n=1 Tax=Rhizodiscina lignyota TaxID=1504668 RepID=A0A9P4IR07_9PEZI|nr:hypothetical protein NA57DRAFT_63002 [Rhizodiscina lignyota]